jgi:hypothetical protein
MYERIVEKYLNLSNGAIHEIHDESEMDGIKVVEGSSAVPLEDLVSIEEGVVETKEATVETRAIFIEDEFAVIFWRCSVHVVNVVNVMNGFHFR